MKTTRTSRPSSLRMRGPAAALAAILLVAGCGNAEEPTEPDAAASPTTSEAPVAEAEPEDSATESASEPEESATESATEDTTSETEEAAAEDLVITIAEFAFEVPDSIPAGSEITVTNEDSVGHTVTSDEEGVFDVLVGPGEEVAFTVPEEAGEFPFHCTPHPNMISTLVVG